MVLVEVYSGWGYFIDGRIFGRRYMAGEMKGSKYVHWHSLRLKAVLFVIWRKESPTIRDTICLWKMKSSPAVGTPVVNNCAQFGIGFPTPFGMANQGQVFKLVACSGPSGELLSVKIYKRSKAHMTTPAFQILRTSSAARIRCKNHVRS